MESSGLVLEKFVKFVTEHDVLSDDMVSFVSHSVVFRSLSSLFPCIIPIFDMHFISSVFHFVFVWKMVIILVRKFVWSSEMVIVWKWPIISFWGNCLVLKQYMMILTNGIVFVRNMKIRTWVNCRIRPIVIIVLENLQIGPRYICWLYLRRKFSWNASKLCSSRPNCKL